MKTTGLALIVLGSFLLGAISERQHWLTVYQVTQCSLYQIVTGDQGPRLYVSESSDN